MKDSKIIHSFDPGESTGYVAFNTIKNQIIEHNIFKNYYQLQLCIDAIDKYTDFVIIEGNVGRMSTSSQIQMCKLVGFLEGVCIVNNIPYTIQVPASRTGFKRKSKQIFDENFKTYEKHNIDAFAHILAFINKNGRSIEL